MVWSANGSDEIPKNSPHFQEAAKTFSVSKPIVPRDVFYGGISQAELLRRLKRSNIRVLNQKDGILNNLNNGNNGSSYSFIFQCLPTFYNICHGLFYKGQKNGSRESRISIRVLNIG
uniref:Uncharacterized protein n=1 Tax=Ditylenchus dipsaci TaxID=166011 RepID=A0A915DDV7_9BILA